MSKNNARISIYSSAEEFVSSQPQQKVGDWLIDGLIHSNFQQLHIYDEPDIAVQLKDFYNYLSVDLQRKFKRSLTEAIAQWTPVTHGPLVFRELMYLSAYIRATEVIEYLRLFIKDDWLKQLKDKDEYKECLGTALGVLAGFAPFDGIELLLEDFLEDCDNKIPPEYAAQIFVGLCRCQPKDYPRYAKKFLSLYQKYPDIYQMKFVIPEFARLVTLPTRNNKVNQLDLGTKELLEHLFERFSKELFVTNDHPEFDVYKALKDIDILRSRLRELAKSNSEDSSSKDQDVIARKNKPIDNKNKVLRLTLKSITLILKAQLTAVFLFSKKGDLCLTCIHGFDSQGKEIENVDWLNEERHVFEIGDEDNNFIVKAAIPHLGIFGQTAYFLNKKNLPAESYKRFAKITGDVDSGVAVPLNGANKTFGVLVILNKLDIPKSQRGFSENEANWLSHFMGPFVARKISDLRKEQQKNVISFLENKLRKTSSEDSEQANEVYQAIVDRLISDNTSFTACILRIKHDNELKETARSNSDLVTWNSRSSDSIRKDETSIDTHDDQKIMTNPRPEFLNIRHSNLSKFSPNENWVKENGFKSFARFPLVVREQVVGTLSLYVNYNYEFHPSCVNFLNTITTLLALFIRGQQEKETIESIKEVTGNIIGELDKLPNNGQTSKGAATKVENVRGNIRSELEKLPDFSDSQSWFRGAEGSEKLASRHRKSKSRAKIKS
jgi:hypothetical protein